MTVLFFFYCKNQLYCLMSKILIFKKNGQTSKKSRVIQELSGFENWLNNE